MSWQPNCAIAKPSAAYGFAISVMAVKLYLRGGEPSRDLERWSG
jgi:hypothetical protein